MKGRIAVLAVIIILFMVINSFGTFRTDSKIQLKNNYSAEKSDSDSIQLGDSVKHYSKGDLSESNHDPIMDTSFLGNPPSSFSWKSYGGKDWTSPVRNQGNCGSCWAFADIGVIESLLNILSLDPNLDKDLAEQYLVSCCTITFCNGCQGAALTPPPGFANFVDWTVDHDVVSESCFPYEGIDSNGCDADGCDHTPVDCIDYCTKVAPVLRWGWVSSDPTSIKNALITQGPLLTQMRAYDDLDGYPGGVYYHDSNGDYVLHDVVIVGYDDAQNCWICKNSWGPGWGENGFFRIQYGCCEIGPNVLWIEVDYGYPTQTKDGVLRYQADSGWHEEGQGMHCDNIYGTSDQRVYYNFSVPKDTVEPIVIGTEFWSRSPWPNLNGPDLEVYYPPSGSWVKIKSSLGNNDGLLWKRYMVLNDYISSSNELKFRLMCAPGDNVYVNQVSVKYTEPAPPEPIPNLDCNGQISKTNVKPGSKVTGSFTVTNIGEKDSKLDWEVTSHPDWGSSWSFNPSSGNDLKPSDGAVTVTVSFYAPNENYQTFGGKIKVINTHDSSDYDEIPIAVVTPRSRLCLNTMFPSLFQNFPFLKELFSNFLLQIK